MVSASLLNSVKSYLKVTWSEEDGDIEFLISRGVRYLSSLAGTTPDFESEGLPKQLLLDFCRYTRNNSFEYFQQNLKSDLVLFTLQEAIRVMPVEGDINVWCKTWNF